MVLFHYSHVLLLTLVSLLPDVVAASDWIPGSYHWMPINAFTVQFAFPNAILPTNQGLSPDTRAILLNVTGTYIQMHLQETLSEYEIGRLYFEYAPVTKPPPYQIQNWTIVSEGFEGTAVIRGGEMPPIEINKLVHQSLKGYGYIVRLRQSGDTTLAEIVQVIAVEPHLSTSSTSSPSSSLLKAATVIVVTCTVGLFFAICCCSVVCKFRTNNDEHEDLEQFRQEQRQSANENEGLQQRQEQHQSAPLALTEDRQELINGHLCHRKLVDGESVRTIMAVLAASNAPCSSSSGVLARTWRSAEASIRSHVRKPECSICLETYEAGDTVCWAESDDCNHIFHRGCIQRWLENHDECPLCRTNLLTQCSF